MKNVERMEGNSMKLTDNIKEKLDNAKSEEEVKTILENVKGGAEDAGVILEDADLDNAAGGYYIPGEVPKLLWNK